MPGSSVPLDFHFHEAAHIFPMMDGPDFANLKADIAAKGLAEAIWTYEGQILDGRNRYRACRELGIQPTTRDYGGADPIGFVVSQNLHRRHLDESQRAMVGARLKELYEPAAKQRQLATQNNNAAAAVRANLREQQKGKASDQAASAVNVSSRAVEAAAKVLKDGVPELIQAVEAGQVPVSTAAAVATLPQTEQAAAVAQGPRAVKTRAKRAKAEQAKAKQQQPTRNPLERAINEILILLASVEAGPESRGWGGIDQVVRAIPPSQRAHTRRLICHLIESLQEWLVTFDHIGESRNGGSPNERGDVSGDHLSQQG